MGREVPIERLAEIFLEQQQRGAHNINLVTPTHFTEQIKEALVLARAQGLNLPIAYNCGGYELPETIMSLAGFVDIFLTDFKYASPELAKRYSNAADYPQIASEALDAMYALVGAPVYDETGIMKRGIIVRHLLLPGCLDDSKAVIKLLSEKPYMQDIVLSVMNQYTPMEGVADSYPELAKLVSEDDYDELIDYTFECGFEDAFCQEGGAASESFIPAFDYEGV